MVPDPDVVLAATFVVAATAGVKTAAISGAIGAVVGASTSVVGNRISTGSWKNSTQIALKGAVDGFVWLYDRRNNGRSFTSCSSGFKVAAKASVKAGKEVVSSGIKVTKNVKILSPDKLYHKTNGGTLVKIEKFFESMLTQKQCFMHTFPGPFAKKHFPLGVIVSGIYGGVRR